jgi:hypothetical protein
MKIKALIIVAFIAISIFSTWRLNVLSNIYFQGINSRLENNVDSSNIWINSSTKEDLKTYQSKVLRPYMITQISALILIGIIPFIKKKKPNQQVDPIVTTPVD